MKIYQEIFQPIGNKYAIKEHCLDDVARLLLNYKPKTDEDFYQWGKEVAIFLQCTHDRIFREKCTSILYTLDATYYISFYKGFADGQHHAFHGKMI